MKKEDISKYINDNSAIYPGDAEFMYDTISTLPDVGVLLETGTGYGHSAVFFSNLKPNWEIFTIDGYGEFGSVPQFFSFKKFDESGYKQTKGYIEDRGTGNVELIVGDSTKVNWTRKINVLFLDGDHTFEGLKADFEKYSPFADVVFVHDYDLDMEGNNVNEYLETVKDKWNLTSACHTAKLTRK